MPFPGPLASYLTTLRGTNVSGGPRYKARQYISFCPNRIMMKSTLAATPAGNAGYATLTFGTVTEGATGNVKVGMLVLVGTADDPRLATWRGRVRSGGITGSTLNIGETSAALTSGQYVWVIEDYPLFEKDAREDGSGNYYKDWDQTFRQLLPQVYGIQQAYAGFVNPATGYYRVAFSVSRYAATSGGSTPSCSWTFPAGAPIVSGGTNQPAVTVDFPASLGNWCLLEVTEGGRTHSIPFIVFPHDKSTYAPPGYFGGATITGSVDSGWSATFEAFDGASELLDGTLTCIWDVEWYNGVQGPLLDAVEPGYSVELVGRLRNETDAVQSERVYGNVPSLQYTVEGLGAQLSNIRSPNIAMRDVASPTVWDEINVLTIWREILHVLEHSTLGTGVNFDSVSDNFMDKEVAAQAGNLLAALNTLASGMNAGLMFTPGGEIRVARDARYLNTSERNALTTVANWTNADWLSYSLVVDHKVGVGKCTADGGTYFPTARAVFPYLAVAPGITDDSGPGEAPLTKQVLISSSSPGAAKQELGDRAGDHWAKANTPYKLTVSHPDGYHFLVPRLDAWYTFTIPATENTGGRAFTTSDRWLLTSIRIVHDHLTGTKDVQATYEPETDGPRGVAWSPPADGAEEDYLPVMVPFDLYPELGGDFSWIDPGAALEDIGPITSDPNLPGRVVSDGNVVVIFTASAVYRTQRFINGGINPPWEDITPPDSAVIAGVVLDHTRTDGGVGLYVLGNDETNSYVDYLADVLGSAADFVRGESVAGIYQSVRVMDTPGVVEMYSPEVVGTLSYDAGTHTITFEGDGYLNFTPSMGATATPGYNSDTSLKGDTDGENWAAEVTIEFPNDKTITSMSCMARLANEPIGAQSIWPYFKEYDADDALIRTRTNPAGHNFNWQSTNIGPVNDTGVHKMVIGMDGQGEFNLPAWIDNVSVTFSEDDPPSTGGNGTVVQHSTDYGVTFAGQSLPSSPDGGPGGFDVARVGDVSLAAADGQAYKATTRGGAFSSAGTDGATTDAQPVLIMYPWYRENSTTSKNFSTSTPDYVLGASALVSGECLWWVAGAGGRTDITPSGATAAAGPDCCAAYYGTKLAAIMLVSSDYKLFTSTDGGSTWSDRGTLVSGSKYLRFRRVGGAGNQLYVVNGTNIKYSANPHAASPTWVNKTGPGGTILGVEPWG